YYFFFSSRRRHTRFSRDWSSDVCSSDLLHNLAGKSEYAAKEAELMALLKKWQKETHDTVTLTAAQILPMDYDPSSFQRKPDVHQPEYILNRYFRNND